MIEPQKILFLDFDGVLNAHGQVMAGCLSLPECVGHLNTILAAARPKIVCCSAWRYLVHNGYMTVPGLSLLLQSHGVQSEVIDVTRPSRDKLDMGEPRWAQIADWIKRPLVPIARYAIIDDDPDAFGGRPGVRTNGSLGLTAEDAAQVIELLTAERS